MRKTDALVIGGGFFGCVISHLLKKELNTVALLEARPELMTRASYSNQARVHGGYHYPRSLMTALRSSLSYERFRSEFGDCIYDEFDAVYAVAKFGSKVSAAQFSAFMARVSAPLKAAPAKIVRLFSPHLTESVWLTRECAFNADILRSTVHRMLEDCGIEKQCDASWESIARNSDGFVVTTSNGEEITAKWIFNCTYSGLNHVLERAHLERIPLKHELAEMALVEPPEELRKVGITVMCGPFFSLMPFPARGLHTLSHVRYTPHYSWMDQAQGVLRSEALANPGPTNFPMMQRDSLRIVPLVKECRYVDSLWEVKTVLPQTELDDGRPILFRRCPSAPQFVSVMGGKIDNIFDLPAEMAKIGLS